MYSGVLGDCLRTISNYHVLYKLCKVKNSKIYFLCTLLKVTFRTRALSLSKLTKTHFPYFNLNVEDSTCMLRCCCIQLLFSHGQH